MERNIMPKEHILANDIITDHRERMLNLKKYYPFFRLSDISFSWFREGEYENLDMGYILMAVLRFFIEENNFKEQDVTYQQYVSFMTECIKRDFGIILDENDNKILVDYIFEKLKNDGKPFFFEYYDPIERIKKISRVKLLESRIQDGTVWYSISADGIEFYLDTKEIKDESKISVEQLLLEKMIQSKDFKGGTQVVKRINQEVNRLYFRKNQVIELLTTNVFSGVEAYREFFDTGIRWFDEEQKLFVKNKELIQAALKKSENKKIIEESDQFYRTSNEIYRLDTELKVAMNNHSQLLKACIDLGIKTDDMIHKSKLSRLRSRFDFKSMLENIIQKGQPSDMDILIKPFMGLNMHKTFSIDKLQDILTYKTQIYDTPEISKEETEKDIVFQDEIEHNRFVINCKTLLQILFEMLYENDEISLRDYNLKVKELLSDAVFKNGDYYVFLVHLCEKKIYELSDGQFAEETFLDEIIREFINEPMFLPFKGMRFHLELAGGEVDEIEVKGYATITNFRIKKESVEYGKS